MMLQFALSGSVLFSTEADCVPPIGSVVHITTEAYKKGLNAGSVISVRITKDDPPVYNFTEPGGPVVYIDLNGYEVLAEGPSPPDAD
jgi:hypothetical protein